MQLIEEKTAGQPEVSVYTIKDKDTFLDFCVGPHVPTTGRLKAFKLTSTSNAYWKGDAKNAPMQRVYGTAFFSQEELDEHLARLEEAKKRDHRKVGKELGLFAFHPWAPGAVLDGQRHDALQHARGLHARQLIPAGYQEVKRRSSTTRRCGRRRVTGRTTARTCSSSKSSDGDEMGLKPMNCPGTTCSSAREAQLQGNAAPVSRADAAAPQRSVRHSAA